MRIPLYRPGRKMTAAARAELKPVAFADVDDDRHDIAGNWWTLRSDGYASRSEGGRTVLMHHMILPRKKGLDVSHEDGCKLNNRSNNLVYRTRSRNILNTNDALRATNSSGFRGVSNEGRDNLTRPWRGKVQVNGVLHQTDRYATAEEAAVALNALRRMLCLPEDPRIQEYPTPRPVTGPTRR